jgi:hypothetical protein
MWYPAKSAFRAGSDSGGDWNDANVGEYSVGFGQWIVASGGHSVAMGNRTTASGDHSTAMGIETVASFDHSTAMGFQTTASGAASTAMGLQTTASALVSTAMGDKTVASGFYSTALGSFTEASDLASTAMGSGTTASGRISTAMGSGTTAGPGQASTSMGWDTQATGQAATAMGRETTASAWNSTAMGYSTTASGSNSIAMGLETTASGFSSTAMGNAASTNGMEGAFVYGDRSNSQDVLAPAENSFTVRASGGFNFYTSPDLSTGVTLATGGGSWNTVSDRNMKENFQAGDGEVALAAIAAMPIQTWNYKAQDPSIRHMGPMAQDFYAAFGLGHDGKHINTLDIDGVNMLGVQALEKRTRDLQAENEKLREANSELTARVDRTEAALARLEALVSGR